MRTQILTWLIPIVFFGGATGIWVKRLLTPSTELEVLLEILETHALADDLALERIEQDNEDHPDFVNKTSVLDYLVDQQLRFETYSEEIEIPKQYYRGEFEEHDLLRAEGLVKMEVVDEKAFEFLVQAIRAGRVRSLPEIVQWNKDYKRFQQEQTKVRSLQAHIVPQLRDLDLVPPDQLQQLEAYFGAHRNHIDPRRVTQAIQPRLAVPNAPVDLNLELEQFYRKAADLDPSLKFKSLEVRTENPARRVHAGEVFVRVDFGDEVLNDRFLLFDNPQGLPFAPADAFRIFNMRLKSQNRPERLREIQPGYLAQNIFAPDSVHLAFAPDGPFHEILNYPDWATIDVPDRGGISRACVAEIFEWMDDVGMLAALTREERKQLQWEAYLKEPGDFKAVLAGVPGATVPMGLYLQPSREAVETILLALSDTAGDSFTEYSSVIEYDKHSHWVELNAVLLGAPDPDAPQRSFSTLGMEENDGLGPEIYPFVNDVLRYQGVSRRLYPVDRHQGAFHLAFVAPSDWYRIERIGRNRCQGPGHWGG